MTDQVTPPQNPQDDGATSFKDSVSLDKSPRTPKDNGAIDSEESASTHASSQILANDDKADFGDFVSTDYEEFEL